MLKFLKILLLFLFILILFNSCKLFRPDTILKTGDDFDISNSGKVQKEYRIQKFDKIGLTVYSNEGMQVWFNERGVSGQQQNRNNMNRNGGGMQFDVEFDGTIKFPVLGRVSIDTLTVREAEDFLEKEFSKHYNNPYVRLEVTNRKVYIWTAGSSSARVVNMSSDNFTIIDAITYAGGIPNDGKAYRIKLIRGDLTKAPKVYLFDLSKLINLRNTNILLEANDIIYIEARPRYISRFLRELQPFLSLVTTFITIKLLYDSSTK